MEKNNLTKDEIQRISKEIVGKKISSLISFDDTKNKGSIGRKIESEIFKLKNNNRREPDFKEAGIELKVIPLKELKNKKLSPKERMIITMINYMEDYKKEFKDSHLFNKIKLILIIQYIHNYENIYDSIIYNQFLYEFPEVDLKIIENDYKKIIKKIKDGEAHLISEADTLYLGAAIKGSGKNKDYTKQPFSEIKAKRRAFSIKSSYLKIINSRKNMELNVFNKRDLLKNNFSFEKTIKDKINKYEGRKLKYLAKHFNLNINSKSIANSILSKMLNFKGKIQNSTEFIKANIEVKSVVIINEKIKENISFKAIDFDEIKDLSWEDYWLRNLFFTKKFLFVIFQGDSREDSIFKGIKIWNMPVEDINEYRFIYDDTRKKCKTKGTVNKVLSKGGKTFYKTKFIGQKNHHIGHVRPHAKNNKDTVALPSGEVVPKQSFWLNKDYILKQIK